MAQRTGTAQVIDGSDGGGTAAVSVPADCTAIVLFWTFYDENGNTATVLSIDGDSFLPAESSLAVNTGDFANGVGVAVLPNPSTGSQTLTYEFTGADAVAEGGAIVLVYVKDVDTADLVRDADTTRQSSGSGELSLSLTSVTDDLVLGFCHSYDGTNPGLSGTVFINNQTVNLNVIDVSEVTAGDPSTSITMTNESYSSMAGISLKASASDTTPSSRTYTTFYNDLIP